MFKINFNFAILIPLFFSTVFMFAQSKTIFVTYKSYTSKADDDYHISLTDAGNDMNIAEELAKKFEYNLICNFNESLFYPSNFIDVERSIASKMAKILFQGKINYTNNLTAEKIEVVNLNGEQLNLIRPVNFYKWNITNETKQINSLKCYKAIATWNSINKIRNSQITNTAVAWFCPEIPVSFGPNGIDGLPGLVLEGTLDGILFFVANKINLDYYDNKNLQKPKHENVTIDDYPDLILKEYSKYSRK